MAGRYDHTNDADFLIVDVETTGLSAESGDRVCEVGAVKLRGGAVVETFGSLVDPRRPVSAGAYAVNGISPAMLVGAPLFPELAGRLAQLAADCAIVAYNAPFDLAFLRSEFRLAGEVFPENPVVDVLALARQVLPGLPRYPQDAVARILGVSDGVKHRALDDAMVTAKIFSLFAGILRAHDHPLLEDLRRTDLPKLLRDHRVRLVRSALAAGGALHIKYLSGSEITAEIVTPREFIQSAEGSASLIAFCHSAGRDRNYFIDRIMEIRAGREL